MHPNEFLFNEFFTSTQCPICTRSSYYDNINHSKSCYSGCFVVNGSMLHVLKPIQFYLLGFNLYAGYYNNHNNKSVPIQLFDINNQSIKPIISHISKLITFS